MAKRYYMYNVVLDNGAEFIAKVEAPNVEKFNEWIKTVPGMTMYTENKATNKIKPWSSKKSKISQARIAAGLTQQEFADKLGVYLTQAQYWEYGRYKPKYPTLAKMSEILGVAIDDLVEDED